jgi:HlyD family secretion protein
MSSERSVEMSRLRLASVVRGNLERDLSVQGRVVAAFHPTVFSTASGIVTLEVRAGDVVQQGQVIAVVESPELNNMLQQEQSNLLSMESDLGRQQIQTKQQILADRQAIDLADVELDAARRAMRRAEESRDQGIINAVEFETAEDQLRRTDLALAHAKEQAALEEETLNFEVRNRELSVERQRLAAVEVQRQVEELMIRAPVTGLISRVDVEDRDAVTPGQPLITVVDLSAFEIEMMIPESYADEVGPGTAAVVREGNQSYPATVKMVSPEVEGGQVRGIVIFDDGTPEGLRQNQRVSTRLVLESRSDVLKVQRGPFLESSGGRSAYRIDDKTAELIPIRVGATSVGEVEIVSGLEVGDRIIISDTARFEEAQRLFLRE